MANTQQLIASAEQEFKKAFDHLLSEFGKLQMGRASATIVEDLKVEAYGSMQPIKAVASISIPDPKTIQIQPWDKNMLSAVEKAIQVSNLGLNPINDGKVVRVPMPPLTEERRRDLVKVVHQMEETAKISVRTARGTAHSSFKTMEESSEISEDERRLSEKQLQDKVDNYNRQIEESAKKKEQDIMTI